MNFHVLRKQVMFTLAKKCGLDTCYRCKKKIRLVKDFSIEHKLPWRNPAKLFLNMKNIAFSHLSCNSRERKTPAPITSNAPRGKAWCTGHKKYLAVAKFHKNTTRKTSYYCKDCTKAYDWKRRGSVRMMKRVLAGGPKGRTGHC